MNIFRFFMPLCFGSDAAGGRKKTACRQKTAAAAAIRLTLYGFHVTIQLTDEPMRTPSICTINLSEGVSDG